LALRSPDLAGELAIDESYVKSERQTLPHPTAEPDGV
jgi:hypothetical protein